VYDDFFLEGEFVGWKNMLIINKVSLVLLLMTFVSISIYFILYYIVLKSSSEKIALKSKIENDEEHLSYLATYILPFLGLNFDSWQSVVASILLFYVLGVVYIRTNLILTNPTLTFFGFDISKYESNKGLIFIIHKGDLSFRNSFDCVHLTNNIYIKK
jgi:hypothetical protein